MRPPTIIRGSFRLRYRIRNKTDRLIIIDHHNDGKYINEISIIDVNKCSYNLIYKLLCFIYTDWYQDLYDFFDKIRQYDDIFLDDK